MAIYAVISVVLGWEKLCFQSCSRRRLVERRGFEPLTSAVQAPARLTGSSLPFLCGWSTTSVTARAGPLAQSLFQRPPNVTALPRDPRWPLGANSGHSSSGPKANGLISLQL